LNGKKIVGRRWWPKKNQLTGPAEKICRKIPDSSLFFIVGQYHAKTQGSPRLNDFRKELFEGRYGFTPKFILALFAPWREEECHAKPQSARRTIRKFGASWSPALGTLNRAFFGGLCALAWDTWMISGFPYGEIGYAT
jgi:hypothetical protein